MVLCVRISGPRGNNFISNNRGYALSKEALLLNEIIVGGALAGKTLVSFHILPLRAAAVQAHPLQPPPLILAGKKS
jgi:hypothetical protein